MPYFPKMNKGDQKGDQAMAYFGIKILKFLKFSKTVLISNQNRASVGPPFGPPYSFLENMDSQLSLEKKIIEKY